jgi:hypothetical protein
MQGAPEKIESQNFEHAQDVAQFRRPAHRDGIELYRAHIVRHAFEPPTKPTGWARSSPAWSGSVIAAASTWRQRIRW